MKKFILFFLLIFTVCRASFAAVENYQVRKEATQLVISSSVPLMTLYDDKYLTMATNPSWASVFTNYAVKNTLRLGINPNAPQTNDLVGSIDFQLKLWKWNAGTSTFDVTTETIQLDLNYSNTNTTAITDEIASYAFADAHRVEVYILAINGGAAFDVNDVFVSAEAEVERYYAFDGNAVAGLSISSIATYYQFDWNHKVGAEFYELEWVHVSDATLQSGVYKTTSALTYDYYPSPHDGWTRGSSACTSRLCAHSRTGTRQGSHVYRPGRRGLRQPSIRRRTRHGGQHRLDPGAQGGL